MWCLIRWAFNGAAAVSAVLFVGVCVLSVLGVSTVAGHHFWLPELALDLAILPFGWVVLWRLVEQQNRLAANIRLGLCPRCGYDLRATPDRCPECGAVPMTKGV